FLVNLVAQGIQTSQGLLGRRPFDNHGPLNSVFLAQGSKNLGLEVQLEDTLFEMHNCLSRQMRQGNYGEIRSPYKSIVLALLFPEKSQQSDYERN
ncbi:MAG TPA: hypothetical protein VFB56_00195, partial [Nitrospiraceae bacterium]|nr:hypothetical protein [Nitrospiraceae bacterium]